MNRSPANPRPADTPHPSSPASLPPSLPSWAERRTDAFTRVGRRMRILALALIHQVALALAQALALAPTIALTLTLSGWPARAQSPEERIAFDAAVRALHSGFAEKAATDLAAFRAANPTSSLLPDAVLLEARARADISQTQVAIQLLEERLESIGSLKDQALHFLGEIHMRHGDFAAAARAFHRLIVETPNSGLLLKAGFGEALALFRSGDYPAAADLLSVATNAFPVAAAAQPNDELAVRGSLLLAEARLRGGNAGAAEAELDRLTNRPLTPVQAWERQFLVTSLLLTNQQTVPAIQASSNLLVLAQAAASRDLVARSHSTRADVLLRAAQPAEAFNALTNNLADSTPVEWRRDALLGLSQIPLDPPRIEPAITLLSTAAKGDSRSDLAAAAARVAIAELRLQQHFAQTGPTSASNRIGEVQVLLSGVVSNTTSATVAGRAWYALGWCALTTDQPAGALQAFQYAANLLPHSTAQAIAQFKLGDCFLQVTNYAAALTNYLHVIQNYVGSPDVRGAVRERALYLGALAALESGQRDLASDLAGRAVLEFPDGRFRDDTRILYGQALARLDPPHRARETLQQLSRQLVNFSALPDLQLAVARSYLRERNWTPALQQLDDWTRTHTNHPGIARAEFERGWAAFKAGNETKAFEVYTNFLARFPDDPDAPQAQMWVADHLYGIGNFAAAEGSYQLVFQRTNWPVSRLTFESRLMAGRAAFARQGYKDAKPYFRWLIANGPPAVTNSAIPPELVARAYFALGDAFLLDPESDDKLTDAMNAFVYVIEKFPDSRESVLAQGKLANCHLQRAELDPSQATAAYAEAARLYLEILKTTSADIATRSQAEVGLALVREKQAPKTPAAKLDPLHKEALDRLLNVFQGGNLRPGENASPFWLNRAGVEAARLAESLGLREQSAAVYETLARTFPTSAAAFQLRASQLRAPR
ncbi:MAG: tetratricopeptide repeat protein [Limisphaerales bacterium]